MSTKYPMKLATKWPVLLRAWQTFNVNAVATQKPPLHNFIQILYFTLEHPAFDIHWRVGHGKVVVAWMKSIWPLYQRVTCKPWITRSSIKHVNKDRYFNSKWCYELSLHFIVTCSYQVLVTLLLRIPRIRVIPG